jgi:hypothetical protein
VLKKFLFVRSNEKGSENGNGTHTRFLCHLRESHGLPCRHGARARINWDPSPIFIDNHLDDAFFLLKSESIKFALTSDWKESMNASLDQVVRQFPQCCQIDLPVRSHRGNHGRDNTFRLEIHFSPPFLKVKVKIKVKVET